MPDHEQQLHPGQQQIYNGVRTMLEYALNQTDGDRLLQLTEAVGKLAAAATEFSALVKTSIEETQPDEVPAPAAPAIPLLDVERVPLPVESPPAETPAAVVPEPRSETPEVEAPLVDETPAPLLLAPEQTPSGDTKPKPQPAVTEQAAEVVDPKLAIFKPEVRAYIEAQPTTHRAALIHIFRNPGRKFARKDVRSLLGHGTDDAIGQRFTTMMNALASGQLSEILKHSGIKSTRKYWIIDNADLLAGSTEPAQKVIHNEPESHNADEAEPTLDDLQGLEDVQLDDEPDVLPVDQVVQVARASQPRPTPLSMPPRKPVVKPVAKPAETAAQHEAVVTQLTEWGLSFSDNGHKRMLVDGNALLLRGASLAVLTELVRHPDGVSFETLLTSLQESGKVAGIDVLRTALAEIKDRFEDKKCDQYWDDKIVDVDGEPDRFIKLEGLLALEADFLDQRLSRSFK